MSPEDRARLRTALREVEPWLTAADVGPQAVDAGPCDRCGDLPRLLPTCGPGPWAGICRDCARRLGPEGWCEGHAAEGRAARDWAEDLPDHWDVAVTLWWVATGELRSVEPRMLRRVASLPRAVRDLLDQG